MGIQFILQVSSKAHSRNYMCRGSMSRYSETTNVNASPVFESITCYTLKLPPDATQSVEQ